MISLLISYLGIYVGVFLGWLSPEEMNPGKTYFDFLQRALFTLIGGVILFELSGLLWVAFISLGLLFLKSHRMLIYFFIPLIYFFIPSLLLLSVFFLYGLPFGSNIVQRNVKQNKIKKTYVQLMLIAFKESWLFFISFGAYLILALL